MSGSGPAELPAAASFGSGDLRECTDKELMARHTAGEPDAFGELFRRHKDRMWGVALRTLRYASSYTAASFSNPFRSAIRAPRPLRPPRNGVAKARQVDLSYARTRGGSGNTSNPSKWRT